MATMGSPLKTSVLLGFLLLLPAVVYCERYVSLLTFHDNNCVNWAPPIAYLDNGEAPNATFSAYPYNNARTFQSAILTNVSGTVLSLIACQVGLECTDPAAVTIAFSLTQIGTCSTAGPAGTEFNRFLIS